MGRKAAAVAALVTLWVLPAFAQHRGAAPSRAIASRPAVASVRSIPVMVRPHITNPRGRNGVVNPTFNPNFNTGFNSGFVGDGGTVQDLFGFPVPGLGFDYTHLAAVNSGLDVRALIDPVTQHEIALALRIRGAGVGAAPFFSPFGGSPVVIESPMVAAQQQDPPAQQPIIVVAPPAPQPAAQAQPAAREEPLPDPGEFVLVQRDGRLLFAVAFTSDPGRVVYITKEGLRRSIPVDQLDVDASLRMNEERGTSISLPRS